jgi:hypothetical protein
MKKLRHFYIVCDYNDGDLSSGIVSITEDEYNKFKPVIEAIANYEPYICRHEMGGIDYSNWMSIRPDLGEKSIYEKYPQFSEELLDEFNEKMLDIPNPVSEYVNGFHTIEKIQEVTFGKTLLNDSCWSISKREPSKIQEYLDERNKLCSYTRKSDGKNIMSIPFSEMTEEELKIIDKLNNLWKEYQ